MRVSMDPLQGLVLHTIGYEDGGRVRPILHRASICEMVVPYGDPGPLHGWKNAFDVGEWGLGRMVNPSAWVATASGRSPTWTPPSPASTGNPYVMENAICIHEEDYGILWKHNDMNTGHVEVRRSRRLVVSFIATVGNYEYGFYWYFYQDGSFQLEVKLTGILSTQALAPGEEPANGSVIAPGLGAPLHQHLFCARLDLDVDGPDNQVYEASFEPMPGRRGQPLGERVPPAAGAAGVRAGGAQRDVDPASSRHWRFVNPGPPTASAARSPSAWCRARPPTLLARPDSSIGQRAGFAQHNLWVTPYAPDERRAAGDYPNQHAGGDGLPAGRRPTGRSPARPSWSGTPSGSPTRPGRRTGR